eukprot:comp5843_c0_seq1/m.1703 comp5843_c0_seq1/g.1703  ORF comp5843_c0_seq1/g.1703 comp5843_c0_seq1/m.1703 type:complete len:116 (-) comp5843_c0_seq1:1160-1507(-)
MFVASFPNLSTLIIKDCKHSDFSGVQHYTHLRHVFLAHSDCDVALDLDEFSSSATTMRTFHVTQDRASFEQVTRLPVFPNITELTLPSSVTSSIVLFTCHALGIYRSTNKLTKRT